MRQSGTRVDGARDLILEKFLNSPEESKPDPEDPEVVAAEKEGDLAG